MTGEKMAELNHDNCLMFDEDCWARQCPCNYGKADAFARDIERGQKVSLKSLDKEIDI